MIGARISQGRRGHGRTRGRLRGVMPMVIGALLVVLTGLADGPSAAAAVEPPTLSIDPPTQNVSAGQEFVVNVIQSATVPTTGAQVNVVFDPKLIAVKDFELGPAYTAASAVFVFGNADHGTNAAKELSIDRANKIGTLENSAGFLLPGSGTIPPGDIVFLKVTLIALPGPGGETEIGLSGAAMIGETGDSLEPRPVSGSAVLAAGGAPAASGSPAGSGDPTPSSSAAPTEAPAAPVSPTTPVRVSLAPTSITLLAGMPARVFLIAHSDGDISSVVTDLTFEQDKLEITGLEPGPAWSGAIPIAVAGGASNRLDAALAEANTTGVLQQAGVFFPPGVSDLPYGQGVFVSVLVKGKVDGTSSLSIGNAAVLGVSGETIPVAIDAASSTIAPAQGVALDPVLVGLVVVLVGLTVAGIAIARSGRIPVRVRRRWPYYASLVLGLIPVVLFGGLVLMLLINSAPVIDDPGIAALFGSEYSSKFSGQNQGLFGLLPALWGSVRIALLAVAIALPISLALAIVAVDFPMGPVSRLVGPLVGLLSGIPPIVYAISVPIFISLYMIPKFAANSTFSTFDPEAVGADPSTWPPADVPYSAGSFPWDLTGVANSTLLGGILIALFLIPFVTPLFADALRDVPRAAREASLALGANRTYTLRRVVLPRALPAITGASMLAVLKALGDTLIVAFAVGWSAERIPQPLFDILERTSSLAAQGAGLIGSFETLDTQCLPAECAVGYSTALMLLALAGVMVVVISHLQARGRRRVAT